MQSQADSRQPGQAARAFTPPEGDALLPSISLERVLPYATPCSTVNNMIWLRRIITIPFGLFLFVFLLAAIVLLEVNDTFLDPDYYRDTLRDADIYRWALNDLATVAFDEAREYPPAEIDPDLDENPLVTSGLSTEDFVVALNQALPHEWVQELVEQVLDEPGNYLTGEYDDFAVTLQAGDRVLLMVDQAKDLMRRADAYNLLFEQIVTPTVEEAVRDELPLGIDLTADRAVASARKIVPAEWVQANVENVLDTLTPYAVGEVDQFEIRLDFENQVDVALVEIKDIVGDSDIYDLVYEEVMDPILANTLGQAVDLPHGVSVTEAEITSALRAVAPREWVRDQADLVIDSVGDYVTMKTDELRVDIDLRDNKNRAREVLVEIARDKFAQVIDDLPECTSSQITRIVTVGIDSLPECMPSDARVEQLVLAAVDPLTGEVERAVDTMVLSSVPNTLTYTQADLENALAKAGAADNYDLLEDVREIIGVGWTYDDTDLKADLAEFIDPEAADRLDDIRGFLSDGWTYTDQDLRDLIVDEEGLQTLDDYDTSREWFQRARSWRLVVYLPVAILMLIIAFLGGRTWGSRIGWAAAYLVVSSAIIFFVFGPVFGAFSEAGVADVPNFDDLRAEALEEIEVADNFSRTQLMASNKLIDILETVVNGFASGVAGKAFFLGIVGLIILGVAISWQTLIGFARQWGLLD